MATLVVDIFSKSSMLMMVWDDGIADWTLRLTPPGLSSISLLLLVGKLGMVDALEGAYQGVITKLKHPVSMIDSPVIIPKDFPLLPLSTTPIGNSLKHFFKIFSSTVCVYWIHLALFNLPVVELAG